LTAFQTQKTLATLKRLDRLARFLDSAYRIPFTKIRIGWEPLLDVVPAVGPLLTHGLSAYIVYEAWRHGAPGALLARMAGRIGIDTLLSVTPVVGWAGDIFYKANLANMADLRAHIEGAHFSRPQASGYRATPFPAAA
jgi:hypothetical protein